LVVRYTADTVSFVVTDTGDGMTPEVLAKCTDPFFTTKSDKKGSGLGLAMVQRFVNEANGRLMIQSTQGIGTEITIELPRVEPMSQAPQNDDPQSGPMTRTGTNVLVVDDNTVLADMTKTVLELEGFAVQVFDNGVSAARYVDEGHRADLVISDIRMPKMNGFEMAEAIRRTSPETQFVFVTGYSDNIARSPNDLGSIVLQKPVSKDELIAAIEVALEPEAEVV
jgi:CheY-like chemotaxis protein